MVGNIVIDYILGNYSKKIMKISSLPKKLGEQGLLLILSWVTVVSLNWVFEEHKSSWFVKKKGFEFDYLFVRYLFIFCWLGHYSL